MPGKTQEVSILCNLFRALVFDAVKRKVLDAPLLEVMDHAFDLHVILTRLEGAAALRVRLQKRKEPTPNLDKAIDGLVMQIKAHRTWAVAYIDKLSECPLPGQPVH